MGVWLSSPARTGFRRARLEPLGLPVAVEAGDVICHTNNILHHSGPVLDETSRATLYLYYAAGQKPAAGTTYTHAAGDDFRHLFIETEAAAR